MCTSVCGATGNGVSCCKLTVVDVVNKEEPIDIYVMLIHNIRVIELRIERNVYDPLSF